MFNKAMAALRAGELQKAEAAAEKAAVRGGQEFFGRRDFVLGNTSFQKTLVAELQASGLEADPIAFDLAITFADKAKTAWQLAATSRTDWPEARRNVERALRKLVELKQKKAEAEQRRLQAQEKPKPPQLQELKPEPQQFEMMDDLVQRLLEKLKEKEQEKRDLRKDQQQLKTKVVKDW